MANFAFLSLGKLHLVQDAKPTEFTSRFGDKIRETMKRDSHDVSPR